MQTIIKLRQKKNQTEYEEKTVIANINPVGRDEFAAAGQMGFKASHMCEIWQSEYCGQSEVEINARNYSIYRTYGPTQSGKIELYISERVGKK